MRIAYVVSMFPCWSETFILNELVSHRDAGVDLSIFSLKRCNEKMVHEEAEPLLGQTCYPPSLLQLAYLHLFLLCGSPLVYLRIIRKLLSLKSSSGLVKLKAWGVFALSPAFVQAARRRKVDAIHAHFATYPALLAWMVGSFLNKPFTFTAHAHDIYVNQDLLPIVGEACARLVTISHFNRRFILDKLGAQFDRKISVIRCGIPLNRLTYSGTRSRRPDGAPFNILSIGRLSGIKGFCYLIEALKLLRSDGVQFCCTIIGDGPLRAALERQAEETGLRGMVQFVGTRTAREIPGYLQDADLFVLACATDPVEGHDGIPVVFMEAMALGVPVVGTRISGVPELIRHGVTGFCASAEDPRSLMEEMKNALTAGDRLPQITGNARQLVEQEFNIEHNSRDLRELFRAQLAGAQVAGA